MQIVLQIMLMCEEPANKEVPFHINHKEMLPSKHKFFVSLISVTLRKAILNLNTFKAITCTAHFSEPHRLQAVLR